MVWNYFEAQMHEPEDDNPRRKNAWMMSFADLLSILLTFFVMLYSMSSLPLPKWQEVAESVTKRLNPDGYSQVYTVEKGAPKITPQKALEPDYLYSILVEKIQAEPSLASLSLQRLDNGMAISFRADALFQDGNLTVKDEVAQQLSLLASIFYQLGNRVDVVSHAPDGGWEEAIRRGVALRQAFRQAGYDSAVRIISDSKKGLYGEAPAVDIVIRKWHL